MAKKKYKQVDMVADYLLIAGALNWGLVVIWQDLVAMLPSVLPTVVYSLVGLAGVWKLAKQFM